MYSREIIYNYFDIVTTHSTGRLHVELLLPQQLARTVTSLL